MTKKWPDHDSKGATFERVKESFKENPFAKKYKGNLEARARTKAMNEERVTKPSIMAAERRAKGNQK